jgi:hypothetical protein
MGKTLEEKGLSLPVSADGAVQVPAFELPLSAALSPESRQRLAFGLCNPRRISIPPLKEFQPSQIGIYGGSAGGSLSAQATAWILEHGMPVPGAIGIFSAGTGGSRDSADLSAIAMAEPSPYDPMNEIFEAEVGYFFNSRPDDYLVNPSIAPESFRARFPSTLIVTGTRAFDLSPAIATHRA